ncbi:MULTISPECIES: 30S ribosomal protein S18 [unclassified Halanaerobium]|uniref:30S ribosomal protein S18 n=1 Tax=unclassified Halanaerobium TaxID=2641197 RepID=UPI000DF4BDFA|nr:MULTISPECIES: 30S ribosomal protein S18 [unclassified Halanaerobium]RCW44135.1 small subunit ribosomal protein S18 [Halanaerobium sp. MA284_MarDTE_T2]RCW86993.1 small subunit ribosomal protein S18 [Halanaerobium sp. DL-01]
MARGHNKSCHFCGSDKKIDYKDLRTLNRYLTDRGKIIPRRITGNCSKHQRDITKAIKRARTVALLPYVKE